MRIHKGFIEITGSGVVPPDIQESSIFSIQSALRELLTSPLENPIITSQSCTLTLSSAAGDNGDGWGFTVHGHTRCIRFDPAYVGSTQAAFRGVGYRLRHYRLKLLGLSIVRRSCDERADRGRARALIVAPSCIAPKLRELVAEPYQQRSETLTELNIKNFLAHALQLSPAPTSSGFPRGPTSDRGLAEIVIH